MKRSLIACGALCLAVGLLGCKGATLPATNISSTGAKLNLHGEADNGPAFSYFEYWQTAVPSLKSTTPVRNWPAGAASDFGESVRGLRQATSYTYRLCGNDSGKPATCVNTQRFTTGVSGRNGIAHSCGNAGGICISGGPPMTADGGHSPSWSPDATKIAYENSGKLWVLDLASGNSAQLGSESIGGNPDWSPDGTKIAVDNGLIRASDGARLTTADTFNPSWSPDGTKLAYECGEPRLICVDGHARFYTYIPYPADHEPAWSPDGTKIAYTSISRVTASQPAVFVMDADGTNRRQLTFNAPGGAALPDWSPSWSPSGTQIAFARLTLPSTHFWTGVNVVDAGGGTPVTQFEGPYPDGPNTPDWSPKP